MKRREKDRDQRDRKKMTRVGREGGRRRSARNREKSEEEGEGGKEKGREREYGVYKCSGCRDER